MKPRTIDRAAHYELLLQLTYAAARAPEPDANELKKMHGVPTGGWPRPAAVHGSAAALGSTTHPVCMRWWG
jgi:hypothetical protein